MSTQQYHRHHKFPLYHIAALILTSSLSLLSSATAQQIQSITNGVWTDSNSWDDELPADAGKDYLIVAPHVISSPSDNNTINFPGDTLVVDQGGTLDLFRAHNFTAQQLQISIPELTVAGGTVSLRSSNGSNIFNLNAPIDLPSANQSLFELVGGNFGADLRLTDSVSGSGDIRVTRNNNGSAQRSIELNADFTQFSGDWLIEALNTTKLLIFKAGDNNQGGWGSGRLVLGDQARLIIDQNFTTAGVVEIDSNSASIEIGTDAPPITSLIVNGASISAGTYTAAQLNALLPNIEILGSGSLTVTAIDPSSPPATFSHTLTTSFGDSVTANFTYHPIRSSNFEVFTQQSDGSFTTFSPAVSTTYIGTVNTHPGALAAAVIQQDGTILSRISFEDGSEWKALNGAATESGTANWEPQWPTTILEEGAGGRVYGVEVGIEIPYSLLQVTGGTPQKAIEMAEFSVMSTNLIYLRDLAVLHKIGKVVIRADQANDPYDDIIPQTNPMLTRVKSNWNAGIPMGSSHQIALIAGPTGVAGLAWVGSVNTVNRYSSNQTAADGDFYSVWRHEVGHNWGANHFEGGGRPEGPTIMSNNSLSRASSSELVPMISHRNSRIETFEDLGPYSFAIPPRANMDRATFNLNQTISIDVLANDADSNGQSISILDFDTTSQRGGTVTLETGAGPDGRDLLSYTPPANLINKDDYFSYQIVDSDGMTATGYVVVRQVFEPTELLAHWPLNEGSGTIAFDTTTAARNGQLEGATTWASPGRQFPSAAQFSLGDEGILAPAIGESTNTLTMTTWLRRDGDQPSFAGILGGVMSGFGRTSLNFDSSNRLNFHWPAGSNPGWTFNSGLTVPDDTWTFCALTISPSQATLYMQPDGANMQSSSTFGSFNPVTLNGNFLFGRDQSFGARNFVGQMEDVRIYNRTLTSGEIADLANGSGNAFSPNPRIGGRPISDSQLTLSWQAPPAITEFNVYVGTDYQQVLNATTASPAFLGTVASPEFILSNPSNNLTFWRIDSSDGTNLYTGPVWYFQTSSNIVSVQNGAWDEANTWNNGIAAPTTGTQGSGEDYTISNYSVTSNNPGSNSQALIASSITIAEEGILDLARLHGGTNQNVTYNLPPLTLTDLGTLQFRASVGSSTHFISPEIQVDGNATLQIIDGIFANSANISGPISGSGTLNAILATNSSSADRTFQINSSNNPFVGNWTISHLAGGAGFAGLRANASNSLGTGTVTVLRRAYLEANAPNALDSLAGVTLQGQEASLRLNHPWVNPSASLSLNSNSSVVELSEAFSYVGNLTGSGGLIRPLDTNGTLYLNQTDDGEFAGQWSGNVTLDKRGEAELSLAGDTGSSLQLDISEGSLQLRGQARTLGSLDLIGGDLAIVVDDTISPALTVTNAVNLNSGSLIARLAPGVESAGGSFELLRYQGTLSGQLPITVFNSDGIVIPSSVDYGSGSNSSITIDLSGSGQAPVVAITSPATSPTAIANGQALVLTATATDDGFPDPPGSLTTTWTTLNGPDQAMFGDPAALSTTVTFPVDGLYTLQFNAFDGAFNSSATIDIEVGIPATGNAAPIVNAGADGTYPLTAVLSGSVTDDGLPTPPGITTSNWSQISGPDAVVLADPSSPTTNVTFPSVGEYLLRLSASDGASEVFDEIAISVSDSGLNYVWLGESDPVGGGNWETTSPNWAIQGSSNRQLWSNNFANVALFPEGTGRINVTNDIEVNRLEFSSTQSSTLGGRTAMTYILQGSGQLNFGNLQGEIDNLASFAGGSRSLQINNNLIGSAGVLINSGDAQASGLNGWIYLVGNNSGLQGGMTIQNGLVGVTNPNSLGTGLVSLQGNAGIFGPSSYSGPENSAIDPDLELTLTNPLDISAEGNILRVWGSRTLRLTGDLSGNGAASRTDGGTLILEGSLAGFTGNLDLSAGSTVITPPLDYSLAANISGSAPLIFSGPGTVTLSGNNTFSSNVQVINGSTVQVNSLADEGGPGSLGAASNSLRIASGGTLVITGESNQSTARQLDNTGGTPPDQSGLAIIDVTQSTTTVEFTATEPSITQAISKRGNGELSLAQAFSADASILVDAGKLTLTGVNSHSGETTINADATLTLAPSADQSHAGDYLGEGTLIKSGSATLTLTASSLHQGDTRLEQGTLSLAAPSLADDYALHIAVGTTLDLPHGQDDLVGELWVDGIKQASGTYTADNTDFISGSGRIVVANNAYDEWLATYEVDSEVPGFAPDENADGSGVPNRLQFVLGGNPTDPSNNGIHSPFSNQTENGHDLILTIAVHSDVNFDSSPSPSAQFAENLITVQASNDLSAWNLEIEEVPLHNPGNQITAPENYVLRSFRISNSQPTQTGFIRVVVSPLP